MGGEGIAFLLAADWQAKWMIETTPDPEQRIEIAIRSASSYADRLLADADYAWRKAQWVSSGVKLMREQAATFHHHTTEIA